MPKVKLDQINFNKVAGSGIKVDIASPTFPWRDLEGLIYTDTTAPATNPKVSEFITGVFSWSYDDGARCHFSFHMPHDYAPGTDIFIHVHWAHNATAVAANTISFSIQACFAKGFGQEAFPAPVTAVISHPLVNIATTPRYQHMVSEVQLSAPTPTSALMDTDLLEVDGLIIGTLTTTIPAASFSGGNPDEEVFIFTVDLHYQSTGIGTKNKAPSFYA